MRCKILKILRLLSGCILLSALLLPRLACAETEGGFSYTVVGSIAVIDGYDGAAELVNIPDTLGGFTVTAIGEEALSGLSADSVSLPRSVSVLQKGAFRGARMREIRFSYGLAMIEEEAFAECENLVGAALPETLETLSGGAFKGCSSLLYVTLPESVRIEEDPFPDCPRLKTLAMVQEHPTLSLIGNKLISREDSRVLSVLHALSPEEDHE